MFGFMINQRFNTDPELSEYPDRLRIVPDV